jgi:hypothetical protein
MFGYGILPAIFAKIQDRDAPEVFSHDYLRFTLGFSRESDRAFIALAKRIGFLAVDGKPTELYAEFLNPKNAQAAMAKALRHGFSALYARQSNIEEIERKALGVLVAELTGLDAGHATARAVIGTFLTLKEIALPKVEVPRATNRRKVPERRTR